MTLPSLPSKFSKPLIDKNSQKHHFFIKYILTLPSVYIIGNKILKSYLYDSFG